MLNVPQLDDLSYEKLFERARSRIPTLTKEWTDFNAHDPGITVLQTFAWLTDTLHYYMDATGEVHRLKYLKLLGVEPSLSVAQCRLGIESDEEQIVMPKGAKCTADKTVFELTESYMAKSNKVTAIYSEAGEKLRDITVIAGMDESYAELFSWNEPSALYIGLQHPESEKLKLHFEIEENLRRNPFDENFSLCGLSYEFYNGTFWQKAELVKDETGALLRSGIIEIAMDGEMGLWENPKVESGYYIRVKLTENNYDLLPMLGKITINCVNAVQTHTISEAVEIIYSGEAEIMVDYAVEKDDLLTVSVESGEGYEVWFAHTDEENSLCKVMEGSYPWQKKIVFKKGKTPNVGDKIVVTIVPGELYEQMVLGITDGTASQEMPLDLAGICELKLAMLGKKDGREFYTIWEQSPTPHRAKSGDRAFFYDAVQGKIIFGDAINGLVPDPELIVMAISLKMSKFEEGNVLKGKVNKSVSNGLYDLKVSNLSRAVGGKHPENSVELENELEAKMKKINRAVNESDYKELVMKTPGLIIDYVNVITMNQYKECYSIPHTGNTIYIAVKPHSGRERATLGDFEKRKIEEHLEKYRLITTNIKIVEPKYVKINVFGRIDLIDETEQNMQIVKDKLRTLIDYTSTGGFGKDIVYGRLFSAIEMLEEVRRVHRISFEVIGKGAKKNERGDIIIYPDALPYLGDIDIEFV